MSVFLQRMGLLGSGSGGGPAGDPFFNSVTLLGKFYGADGSTTPIANLGTMGGNISFQGNSEIDTAQFKFDDSSALLQGTNDYLTYPDPASYNLSVADTPGSITMEAWIRPSGFPNTSGAISGKRTSVGSGEHIWQVQSNQSLIFVVYSGSSPRISLASATGIVLADVWQHVAAVRDGTRAWKLFLNGVEVAAGSQSNAASYTTATFNIGKPGYGDLRNFAGHIDSYRWTRGVARYSATFTPQEFPESE